MAKAYRMTPLGDAPFTGRHRHGRNAFNGWCALSWAVAILHSAAGGVKDGATSLPPVAVCIAVPSFTWLAAVVKNGQQPRMGTMRQRTSCRFFLWRHFILYIAAICSFFTNSWLTLSLRSSFNRRGG
jgi:hypothetical protein